MSNGLIPESIFRNQSRNRLSFNRFSKIGERSIEQKSVREADVRSERVTGMRGPEVVGLVVDGTADENERERVS